MVPRVVPTAVAALGIVLAVVGLVMLTVAAPPQQVGGRAAAAPVLVTAPGALALTGGTVAVDVDGDAFAGLVRAQEADELLAGVARTRVDGVSDGTTLATTAVEGTAPGAVDPPLDPALADVWQRETSEGSVQVDDPQPEDVLVVVAADDASSVDVALTWQRPATHPGAWPLLVVGVLQAVLGVAWLVALNARRARRARTAVRAR